MALYIAVAEVVPKSSISFKYTQVCAYADDVVIIGRQMTSVKGMYRKLETEAGKSDLVVDDNKTKYMVVSNDSVNHIPRKFTIEERVFEEMKQFKLLGNILN